MKINTNTWHYKLYDKTYFIDDPPYRSGTNLCQYMRRLMFSPLWLLRNVLALFLVYVIGGFISLWLGSYPTFANPRHNEDGFEQYQVPEINGYRIVPAYGLIPIALGVLTYFAILGSQVAIGIVIGIAIVACMFGTIWFLGNRPYNYYNDGFLYVIGEWVSAKKARFCPTVEFTNDE